MHDPSIIPPDLPVPVDDGAAAHLAGMRIPSVVLSATTGRAIDLAELASHRLVLFCPTHDGGLGPITL